MNRGIDWLPPIFCLADCHGDATAYLERLYLQFRSDFIDSKPTVFGPKRWAMKRHPLYEGKEATFWHVISEGNIEESRTPDMRRCERLCWIRPMIDSCLTDRVCYWEVERNGMRRPNIALPDFSFIAVLQEHHEYVMLWTAFYVPGERRRSKYNNEWQACRQRSRQKCECRP